MCAPKGRFTAARQGCATCYETVHRTVSAKFVLAKFGAACRWFELIKEKNTEHTKVCAERALYRSAPRLRNLLRNSPPDCFYQICKQIWSSLSLVRVNKRKKYGVHKSVRRKGALPQRAKVTQPATKQSTGLFLPNLQTNLEQLVVGSS